MMVSAGDCGMMVNSAGDYMTVDSDAADDDDRMVKGLDGIVTVLVMIEIDNNSAADYEDDSGDGDDDNFVSQML